MPNDLYLAKNNVHTASLRPRNIARKNKKHVNPKNATVLSDLAGYYGVLGNREKALPLIEQMLAQAPNDIHILFHAALTYEELGERTKALHWLQTALGKGYSKQEVERNPWLAKLRADARYEKFAGGMTR